MSIQWNSPLPDWLTLLLTGALFLAVVHGTAMLLIKRVPRKWAAILTALRLAIFVVFVLILLQPMISFTRQVPQRPQLLILVDTSQSMAKTGSDGSARLEDVTDVLQKGDLAEALRDRFELRWFTFDRTAFPLKDGQVAGLKADGTSTDFAESMTAACDHARSLSGDPRRLLLVSDGNDLGQVDAVETARRFGLTVDVLAPRPQGEVPRALGLEITEVQGPRRVLLGSETTFRVTLSGKQPALRDESLLLRVSENGKKILDHPVILKAGRAEETVFLTHRPPTAGLQQYEFRLSTGAASGKPFPLPVQVVDNKYEVLILEDTWRWEYKYLHRLFEDDPSFRFSALLARGGAGVVRFGSPDRRVNLIGFPQNRTDLEGFDTFVIGDVNPTRWPAGVAAALKEQIVDEGKSLVVIAGPHLAKLLEVPELHSLLPVDLTAESGSPVEGPVEVRFSPDGRKSPFFFQLRLPEGGKLPPLDQIYPVLRKRPGAVVLLEAVKQRNPYGNLIVMAEHTVGRGRVLFLGTDTLWKWHTLAESSEGPTPYSIFWQQAFRALTPIRSNLGPVNLWLTTSRGRAEVGRTVVVQAEVQAGRTLPQANLQAMATMPDGNRLPLLFSADPANPRLFRAEFTSPQPGLHHITASLLADGKALAEATTPLLVEQPRGELGDQGIDLANLTRLAQATGGQIVDPARADSWLITEETSLAMVPQLRTIDLWDNFSLLVLLCVLLGADWFVRLFKGLVAG